MGLGDGFCRTASGARGTFTLASTATIEECQAACSAQPTCVGVEFRPGTCELHTESLVRVSASQGVVCFAKVSPPPTTAPPQIRFVSQVSDGSCSDVGGFPINDVNLPEGCYVFRGFFLFMGVNPQSKGKGAETSTP